jgi:predicted dinucleotide-binding enzyme
MLVVAIVVVDIGIQGLNILNAARLFAAVGDARSRVNTAMVTSNFVAGAIGSAVSGALWAAGGWSAVTLAGAGIAVFGLTVWFLGRHGPLRSPTPSSTTRSVHHPRQSAHARSKKHIMNTRTTLGILGGGPVGATLANGLRSKGYAVAIGNRRGTAVEGWDGEVGSYANVAAASGAVILVVKGLAAEEVVTDLREQLSGKLVIDATNPLNDAAPEDGVLDFFTDLHSSLMERLQVAVPEAYFVKALNSVGHQHMVDPQFDQTPTMFICGDNAAAKAETADLLRQLGWEAADFGGSKSARAIEPLCMLWCIPAMAENSWNHAFRLLRRG